MMGAPVDVVLLSALVLAFAVLVTAHVALLVGLLLRRPRWRAAAALVVPPLAPFWGLEARMRLRSYLWLGALVVYVVSRIVLELTPG